MKKPVEALSRRLFIRLLSSGVAACSLPVPEETLPQSLETHSATPTAAPAFVVGRDRRVTYSSGGFSFVEYLQDGRWSGTLRFGASRYPQPAFFLAIRERPDQTANTLLDKGWSWISFNQSRLADGSVSAAVRLKHETQALSVDVNTLLDGTAVFTRSLTIRNESNRSIAIMELSPWSAGLWPGDSTILLGASGRNDYPWEGWFRWKPLAAGVSSVKEDKGLMWDDPYFILHKEKTEEYAFGQLAWPANYDLEFENKEVVSFRVGPLASSALRVIAPGESIVSPALHLGCVRNGFDAVIQEMHNHVRKSVRPFLDPQRSYRIQYLIPEDWSMTVYRGAEYNESNMKKCVDVAAALGIEVFVLDGPMWASAYGDWAKPNPERFPNGLRPLAEYAHAKGLLFGLYSETEGGRDGYCSQPAGACIGPWSESDAFKQHPDWFVQPRSVLNLSIPDAAEYMKQSVMEIITRHDVDLFRHDFNAPQRGPGSVTIRDGFGEEDYWRHYDAFYEIFRAVHQRYPSVILQQAAAGGARSELATASVFHEEFTSDRAAMPYVYRMLSGLSIFIPPEMWVNANGLAQAHDLPDIDTTLRGTFALGNTPMIFNAIVPKDLNELRPDIKSKFLHYTSLYKQFIRPLLPSCKVYHHAPVGSDEDVEFGNWFAMEFFAPDQERGWATVIRLSPSEKQSFHLRPRGLRANSKYHLKTDSTGAEEVVDSNYLMQAALEIGAQKQSELLLFEMVKST